MVKTVIIFKIVYACAIQLFFDINLITPFKHYSSEMCRSSESISTSAALAGRNEEHVRQAHAGTASFSF
jgi:hypothetical protein